LTITKINFIRPNAFDSTGEEFRWSDIMKVVFFVFSFDTATQNR